MDDKKVITADAADETWVTEASAALPDHIHECGRRGDLPPELLRLKIRVTVRKWPDGQEAHMEVPLGTPLQELMRDGGVKLGIPVLPPGPEVKPLDGLRFLKRHSEWSEPIQDLGEPLWLAIVHGVTRHFGIEFKLEVQINTKWGIAPSVNATPKQLLEAFGFNPAEYSLYPAHSADLLPPDVPLNLKRGDRFEAQKDGRYGATLDTELSPVTLAGLNAAGYEVRQFSENGQTYVEVSNLEVPSPPWTAGRARILIAVPATYPAGGLDAFYIDRSSISHQSGVIPYEQSRANIGGREWGLISWHYTVNRPWDPARDSISSHIAHCRGYFLRRGIVQ